MDSNKRRITPLLIPKVAVLSGAKPPRSQQRACWRQILVSVYNLALWCFIVTVVLSQFLGVVSDSTKSVLHVQYGQSPLLGTFAISGENDEPYSDRMIVCRLRGRMYKPAQLSVVLEEPSTVLVDSSGSAINGYRLVKRSIATLEPSAYDFYTNTCDQLAATLDSVLDSCTALGYNVTRDNLRIVDDLHSLNTFLIPKSLPVLVMPYWDNAASAHFMVPGWDGSACAFRLAGKYASQEYASATLYGPDRSVRENKTVEWLQRPRGVWRNGWYEDLEGSKWYSDIATTDPSAPFGINCRLFDTTANQELRNSSTQEDSLLDLPVVTWWGDKLSVIDTAQNIGSLVISNGLRYGLFLYENSPVRVVKCTYDLETFISNTSVAVLLLRWLVVMLTLQSSYWRHKSRKLESAGLGCLANSRTFLLLPVVLIPRLKQTLTAFFTVGCFFEGDQMVFGEAWFVIYPGVVEFVLLHFSLLNLLARLLHRRMTDAFFGPTLIFLCLLHWLRSQIAQSYWFGIDGRVSTVFSASEFEQLKLFDFFTSNVAMRINGNVHFIFGVKLVVVGLNLVPLIFSASTSAHGQSAKRHPPCQIEKTLAIRACCSGGLGRSSFQYDTIEVSPRAEAVLSSYELLRLGYVVLGDEFLVSIIDWIYFLVVSRISWTRQPSTFRILLIEVAGRADGYEITKAPAFCRVNDPRLQRVRFWQLSAVSFK
ncbi:hypothetical protein Gpo141_00008577 [Globisporangium polare]